MSIGERRGTRQKKYRGFFLVELAAVGSQRDFLIDALSFTGHHQGGSIKLITPVKTMKLHTFLLMVIIAVGSSFFTSCATNSGLDECDTGPSEVCSQ